jgi:glycine/D-amino acid oxidase-like deaminating enzyme
MKRSANESTPVWVEGSAQPEFPPLQHDVQADVCIVGAGIAGLTTGYLLQKAGRSVVVLDACGVAAGETGRTTAHLTAVLDDRFSELESLFGRENTRLAADSHRAAIDRIETIVADERIDCDFERITGYLVALSDRQRRALDKEIDAVPRVGFYDAEGFARVPLPNLADAGPALAFPRQATFQRIRAAGRPAIRQQPGQCRDRRRRRAGGDRSRAAGWCGSYRRRDQHADQ